MRMASAKNIEFVSGDINEATEIFGQETFDYVFSLGVLHHLAEPKRGFQQLARLVKPGGRLFVMVLSSEQGNLWMFLRKFIRPFTRHFSPHVTHILCWMIAVPLASVINMGILTASLLKHEDRPGGRFLGITYGTLKTRSIAHFAVGLFDAVTPEYYSQHSLSEISSWFDESGFDEIQLAYPVNVSLRGTKNVGGVRNFV